MDPMDEAGERYFGQGPPDFCAVLVAQVHALLVLVRAGGDLRTANLDDRLFIDRLQDTLDAMDKGKQNP